MSVFATRPRRVMLLAVAVVAALFPAAPSDAADPPAVLFSQGPESQAESGSSSVRSREATLTVDLERERGPLVLTLNLFDDTQVPVVLHRRVESDGSLSWRGTVTGEPGIPVLLVADDGYVFGSIRLGADGAFSLRHSGPGQVTITEVDTTDLHQEPELPIPPQPAGDEPTPSGDTSEPTTAGEGGGPVIDMMLVITDDVLTEEFAGDTGAADAWASTKVAEINSALESSEVTARVALAHVHHATYSESGDIGIDLNRVTDNGDGHLDEVHTLRDTHGVDVIALVVSNSTSGAGIGWLNCAPGDGCWDAYFFGVSRFDAADGNYTIGHEFGHNIGLRHDEANGGITYARGYRVSGEFATIMSYGCTVVGNSCTDAWTSRVAYYSNPDVLYGATAMGRPIGQPDEADSATHIDNVAATVAAARDAEEPILCNGLVATVVGTAGNDTLYGTSGIDVIVGLGGDDTIIARQGNDTICAGEGDDIVYGHAGDDVIYAEGGHDEVYGGQGDDTIYAGDGNDYVRAHGGHDVVYGGIGDDELFGLGDDDELHGEDGIDTLHGGPGDDTMYGGIGADTMYGHGGDDTMYGEDGDDQMYGGSRGDFMYGGIGNDLMDGQQGADWLYGETGDDDLRGGRHVDRLFGDVGEDSLNGGPENDYLYGEADNDYLYGAAGDRDRLFGGDGIDDLNGGPGVDDLCRTGESYVSCEDLL